MRCSTVLLAIYFIRFSCDDNHLRINDRKGITVYWDALGYLFNLPLPVKMKQANRHKKKNHPYIRIKKTIKDVKGQERTWKT